MQYLTIANQIRAKMEPTADLLIGEDTCAFAKTVTWEDTATVSIYITKYLFTCSVHIYNFKIIITTRVILFSE